MAASASGSKPASENMQDHEDENSELLLFQVKECYMYKIPPRKSAASYRADEWNINKWTWEGALKVVSKGDSCSIRLEDSSTGELFACAPVRPDQPLPVEPVIDSSRFFVLRIEDTSKLGDGKLHAFVGIGFRERPQAYDFQAALFDHMSYLTKKREAEEMELEYKSKPSADYSLRDGQMIHLDIKTPSKGSGKLLKKSSSEHGFPPSPTTPGGVIFTTPSGEKNQIPSSSPILPPGSTPSTFISSASIPALAPPPPSRLPSMCKPSTDIQPEIKDVKGKGGDEDEDFGDFQEAA